MKKALITREVEHSQLLKARSLTAEGLSKLEASVSHAVRAAVPGPMAGASRESKVKPPPPKLAKELARVSNWTDVAKHRAGFYVIEQEKMRQEKQNRVDEMRVRDARHPQRAASLSPPLPPHPPPTPPPPPPSRQVKLKHQMASTTHRSTARREQIADDAARVAGLQKEFQTEQEALRKKHMHKVEAERDAREAQIRDQQARRAATERLKELEDTELLEHLRREKEADAERARKRQAANDDYHRETAIKNAKAREERKIKQKADWEEEKAFNQTWKEMLDKQEADRCGQYERLREKIRKMQRMYEDNAGAEEEARLNLEESMRKKWADDYEEKLKQRDRENAAKRAANHKDMTETLFRQISDKESLRAREREEAKEHAALIRREALQEEQRERDKLVDRRAVGLVQQQFLNTQMRERGEQKLRDPSAAHMTPLEASLNRSLLVSMLQHSYSGMNVLN